ncbi:MAG: SWIM zinc finger family protein [Thaumarchaeota archaeon]|jgi:predicted nucleic acid-binding Zn finger protein|nr:SWIM zinc finger family protein [Candidatus Terraquivivens yellowstonensis]MCL7388007.1 SWIM zinc finger family protein [Candidatus Terraquivivens yellowstonensis]MCL7392634.1 SWIM zinc finger family protein [Candidatus Terraquivivens yellowstonensis]MCL7398168.1 SWIM zinc finger family protein [Candidatus Terraquivivens yellowstonensis]MCL7400948.1 SWIM zinc finger family protein [Candidatus Terraquivivens yellowstonensis]
MKDELSSLKEKYGSMYEEAINAVEKGLVKRYVFKPSGRVRWVVVGRTQDYLILLKAGYCTCDDFYFRVLSHEKPMCYHLLAAKIASESGKYEEIYEEDKWYRRLLNEWLPK